MLRQREPRQRDERYLDYIRSLACCICGDDTATEAAHVRTASIENGKLHTGLAEKPSDKWAVPLCGKCHREQHAFGDELKWWASKGIDPFVLAIGLRRPA